jgi:hypothetical protein
MAIANAGTLESVHGEFQTRRNHADFRSEEALMLTLPA